MFESVLSLSSSSRNCGMVAWLGVKAKSCPSLGWASLTMVMLPVAGLVLTKVQTMLSPAARSDGSRGTT
jgi:hypothetical protein